MSVTGMAKDIFRPRKLNLIIFIIIAFFTIYLFMTGICMYTNYMVAEGYPISSSGGPECNIQSYILIYTFPVIATPAILLLGIRFFHNYALIVVILTGVYQYFMASFLAYLTEYLRTRESKPKLETKSATAKTLQNNQD